MGGGKGESNGEARKKVGVVGMDGDGGGGEVYSGLGSGEMVRVRVMIRVGVKDEKKTARIKRKWYRDAQIHPISVQDKVQV
jgi:hypothetical protein